MSSIIADMHWKPARPHIPISSFLACTPAATAWQVGSHLFCFGFEWEVLAKTILHMHATRSLPSLSKMQPGNSGFLNKTLPKIEGFFAVKVHGRFSLLEALLEASRSISKLLL